MKLAQIEKLIKEYREIEKKSKEYAKKYAEEHEELYKIMLNKECKKLTIVIETIQEIAASLIENV